jgi:hypothetical protein
LQFISAWSLARFNKHVLCTLASTQQKDFETSKNPSTFTKKSNW